METRFNRVEEKRDEGHGREGQLEIR